MSHLREFRIFWKSFTCFSNIKWGKKNNPLFMWEWDRKICPLRSPFVITRKPRDANRWSSGQIFLSHPLMMDSYIPLSVFHCCSIPDTRDWRNLVFGHSMDVIMWALSRENLSSGCRTKRVSNQSHQLQTLARKKMKFHLQQVYI